MESEAINVNLDSLMMNNESEITEVSLEDIEKEREIEYGRKPTKDPKIIMWPIKEDVPRE